MADDDWKKAFTEPIEAVGGRIIWASDSAGFIKWDTAEYKFHIRKKQVDRARRKASFFIEKARKDGVFGKMMKAPVGTPQEGEVMEARLTPYIPSGILEKWVGNRSIMSTYDEFDRLMLTGPAGCGKTMSVEAYAEMVGKPLYTVSCDVDTDKFDLIGKYILMKSDDGGHQMKWVDGVVTRAFETGAILVFDEVNMTRDDVLSIVNSALDERGYMVLKEGDGRMIKAGAGFKCFCTMNEGYQGTVRLNEAFIDRFEVSLPFTYLSSDAEVGIISDVVGKATATNIVMAIEAIRAGGAQKKNLRLDVSHRMTKAVAKVYSRLNVSLMKAFEMGLINKARPEERLPIREIIVATLPSDLLSRNNKGKVVQEE